MCIRDSVAAIDLTMSSMMTVPVAMSAVILPNLVRKKRWGPVSYTHLGLAADPEKIRDSLRCG